MGATRKSDLALNGQYVIELFSFPFPPARPSRPEACGLRHLAFSVDDLDRAVKHLEEHGVKSAKRFVSIRLPTSVLLFNDRTVFRWALPAVSAILCDNARSVQAFLCNSL